jgi:DNA-binding transcriptional LysR family regulator
MIALVQVVASLKQDHPHVHIEMSEKGSVDVMDDVRSGELDLGLVAMPEDQPLLLKDLKFERLYKGKLMIAAGRRSNR